MHIDTSTLAISQNAKLNHGAPHKLTKPWYAYNLPMKGPGFYITVGLNNQICNELNVHFQTLQWHLK